MMTNGPTDVVPTAVGSLRISRGRDWMRRVLGLDRAIGFTILARFWSGAAGILTVGLIARFLSPAEQGYYFTFGSLVALQIIFELGFSYVILQMASHERAHLSISDDLEITGDPIAHARLASVIQKSVRWYSVAAVLLAVALVTAGFQFFSTHQHLGQTVAWRLPWCCVALMATLTFQIDPVLSFLEGCGFVPNIAHLRFSQAIVGSLLAWTALVLHHGLFAPAMIIAGTAGTSIVWLFGKRRLVLGLLRHHPGANRIDWFKEVWPFQWRIGISYLCGYFVFQLFNPVLFAFRGPVAAGQMGMSLSLANALQSVAFSWISTKSAPFGALIARKEYSRLDQLFFRAIMQSLVVCIAGVLVVWFGCIYINLHHLRFAQRLLGPTSLGLLLLSAPINAIIFGEAYYLRAHKQEKFLLNSVVGAMLVAVSTYFLGRAYGAAGIVIGSLCLNIFGLAWATAVFHKYRKLWHASPNDF
jgi:O-antigen/teichoic acid export membrane protein